MGIPSRQFSLTAKFFPPVLLVVQAHDTKHRTRLGKWHQRRRLSVSKTPAYCILSHNTGHFLYQMQSAVNPQHQVVVQAFSSPWECAVEVSLILLWRVCPF